jgi:hypothetical protein
LRLEEVSGRSPLHDVKDVGGRHWPPANSAFGKNDARRSMRVAQSAMARTKVGGARRDRTDDLLLAKQALSQLSYGPVGRIGSLVRRKPEARSQKSNFDFWLLISGF